MRVRVDYRRMGGESEGGSWEVRVRVDHGGWEVRVRMDHEGWEVRVRMDHGGWEMRVRVDYRRMGGESEGGS